MSRSFALCLCAVVVIGCGDEAVATVDMAVSSCMTDSECSDGMFCNGVERCDPSSPLASRIGCVPGDRPCSRDCDEDGDACEGSCEVADADGDGVDAIECGGNDCDDRDASRAPGLPEVCDADSADEDCDATTFGDLDSDGDGFVDATCCNVSASGAMICGDDCDDSEASVHPGEAESCDTFDNDCDGRVDETVGTTCYPDQDNDGFAAPGTMPIFVCGDCGSDLTGLEPTVAATTDCDDSDGSIRPGQSETCDGEDDDCDGATDEGVKTSCFEDADGDQFAPAGATVVEVCGACPVGSLQTPRPQPDCDDANAAVNPGAREICNRIDDDCSSGGGVDESEDMDEDGHAATGADCEVTPASLPKDDCNDGNADVFPGQILRFDTPICPAAEQCTCSGGGRGCWVVFGGFSGCDCGSTGSWDYDCNGSTDQERSGGCGNCAVLCIDGSSRRTVPESGQCGANVVTVETCRNSCGTAAGCAVQPGSASTGRLRCR